MAADPSHQPWNDALAPMPPGPLLRLRRGGLEVALAPEAGGRIAQIRFAGVDWLVGPEDGWPATIAWGCYPMVPWAGRVRGGSFDFDGHAYRLPVNFGAHAIHGVGFSRPWRIAGLDPRCVALSLALGRDRYWPFGGTAHLSVSLDDDALRLVLSVQAADQAMPVVLGWHPWFRKPDRLLFAPRAMYPRDEAGIATLPHVPPVPGPWDDCFLASGEIALEREGQRLRLHADAEHWVVYDGAAHATCVEPQTGPPDAFNLQPRILAPGERLDLMFDLAWEAQNAQTSD